MCDEKYGVYGWNASDIAYRGPQAFAYTDFTGFDCSKAFCPRGDNPWTLGVNEVQAVNCTGRQGSFYLSLRDKATAMIAYDAKLTEVQALLEASQAIGRVRLAFSNTSAATFVVPCPRARARARGLRSSSIALASFPRSRRAAPPRGGARRRRSEAAAPPALSLSLSAPFTTGTCATRATCSRSSS